jgi:putative restriction endonuclease
MRLACPLEPVWGHVLGVPPGATFAGRGELCAVNVHSQIVCGIDARKDKPATCVVIAGGYGDDADQGDVVEYTGEGGQNAATKAQVKDQTLSKGTNLHLASRVAAPLDCLLFRRRHDDSQCGHRWLQPAQETQAWR